MKTRLTPATEASLAELKTKVTQRAALDREIEELTWKILNSREVGAQREVAHAFGKSYQTINNWVRRKGEGAAAKIQAS